MIKRTVKIAFEYQVTADDERAYQKALCRLIGCPRAELEDVVSTFSAEWTGSDGEIIAPKGREE